IGVVIFLLAKNFIPLLPKIKATKRIGIVGQYSFDNLPYDISQVVSRGLTKINPSGEVVPDIAKSWEILEEETLYRVHLKPDSFWSDGTPIVSQDIKLHLPDVETRHPEPYVIEFKLKESYAPFPGLLSQPLWKNAQFGAGDYTIKSLKQRGPTISSISLNGKAQNLNYRFYASYESAWLGFKLGQVDALTNLIVNPLPQNWQDKVNLTTNTAYHQYLGVVFNLNDPMLSSKPLRQALAYAIDNKAPNQIRALSPLSPQSWAYNASVKPYDYNPDQAKELFDRATDEATLSANLSISLGTSQSLLPRAEAIAASWQKVLPVKVDVKIINAIEPNFQAVLIAQEIPLDPDQHPLWHSTQPTNLSHFSDLRVDKLLEDGRKTSDQKERRDIYLDFQR
ncbi:MAG: ABC transporter substrate-binding protein, partial [Patescibacteria group bacterium]|nr:ABC transporter substrate-binding protein [Patescibacteria group bacterium]